MIRRWLATASLPDYGIASGDVIIHHAEAYPAIRIIKHATLTPCCIAALIASGAVVEIDPVERSAPGAAPRPPLELVRAPRG